MPVAEHNTDQYSVTFDERTDPGAPVPGIGRVTDGARAADLRHAEARAGAEERQLQTVSTFRLFVVPGTSNGTPAVTITRSPGFAIPLSTTTFFAVAAICS